MAQGLLGTWAGPGTRAQGPRAGCKDRPGPGPGPGPGAKEPLGHVFSQEKCGNHTLSKHILFGDYLEMYF